MDRWQNIDKNKLQVKTLGYFEINKLDGYPADEVLENGCKQLAQVGAHHWLSSGTLIGLYRDGRQIPFDTDVDVNVLSKEPTMVKLAGFDLVRVMIYDDIWVMQSAFVKNQVIFDIYYFYENGDHAVNVNEHGIIRKPLHFISKLDKLSFKGYDYPVPSSTEDFLKWRFGDDWRIPRTSKQSWEKDATHLQLW